MTLKQDFEQFEKQVERAAQGLATGNWIWTMEIKGYSPEHGTTFNLYATAPVNSEIAIASGSAVEMPAKFVAFLSQNHGCENRIFVERVLERARQLRS